ncbi:glycerol-3-phosphate acyltransferase [Paenibacillus kobensis]|uniref:glycerol-3-phosphate acyltransferase n=1 Tax=Paenibacillus kobensis TaxID=59841 RepID=UPI000FDA24C1|nr:glycerol-3-phosphate acyltransferase [Paenibacillus kobensis]
MIILWTLLSFLCGSLMFSYWLGLLAHHNLQEHDDGNPGAMNLWRTAGYVYGIAGVALDFGKGYAVVLWLIHAGHVSGYGMVPPAAGALLGHAFSPFMRWKGGKAIAVTFGVWSALTGFEASLAYAVILALLLASAWIYGKGKPPSSDTDGFQVVLGMLLLSGYLAYGSYDMGILTIWLINFVLLVYTHRKELVRWYKD